MIWRKLKRLEVQKKKSQFDTTFESWALGSHMLFCSNDMHSCMQAITRRVERRIRKFYENYYVDDSDKIKRILNSVHLNLTDTCLKIAYIKGKKRANCD